MKAAKKKSSTWLPTRLGLFLLLAFAFFGAQNRVWAFSAASLPEVGLSAAEISIAIGENYDNILYDASGYTVAPKNVFPKNADDLLSELPRDSKGFIYPNSKTRIRPESHHLKPGETYAPRHHGQHYHVEIRKDVNKSFNNKKNVIKVKPDDYVPGEGTGFLPGEPFPGQ